MTTLCFSWFVICFNYYAFTHSWCKISQFHKKFEHDLIATALEIIAQGLALTVCYAVKQKSLPLTMLQISSATTYFVMNSIDIDHNVLIYVCHINSFLETAAFALIWTMTIEIFPKPYRYTYTPYILSLFYRGDKHEKIRWDHDHCPI